eukprot:1191022-Prorocentrum_minimum.AAC.5
MGAAESTGMGGDEVGETGEGGARRSGERLAEYVLSKRTDRIGLVLEGVSGRAGEEAALRCADQLGVQRVWRVDPLHAEGQGSQTLELASSSGPLIQKWMEISSHRSTSGCIQALRAEKREIWVLMTQGTRPQGGLSANMLSLDNPGLVLPSKLALVIGGSGVSEQMRVAANRVVYLPQYGFGGPLPVPLMCAMALQLLFVACPVARGDLTKERKNWLRKRWQAVPQLPVKPAVSTREVFFDAPAEFKAAGNNDEDYLTPEAFSVIDWAPSLKRLQRVASRGSCGRLDENITTADDAKKYTHWYDWFAKVFASNDDDSASQEEEEGAPPAKPSKSAKETSPSKKPKSKAKPASKLFPSCSTLEGPFPPEYDRKSEKGYITDVPKGVFQVRSETYLKNRMKQNAKGTICTLLGADLFRTPRKADNLALRMDLPKVPAGFPPPPQGSPSLLVVNLQVPQYSPSFFGGELDGDGLSMVWYFAIDYTKVTTAARGLLQRFLENGVERDGKATRDRLKLILRLANVEEALEMGSVVQSEKRLLDSWNAKPVMARPQHRYFAGKDYLEVVIDLHQWKYLIRKTLLSGPERIRHLIWDFGMVLQGNYADELPEQMLCGVRNNHCRLDSAAVPPPAPY